MVSAEFTMVKGSSMASVGRQKKSLMAFHQGSVGSARVKSSRLYKMDCSSQELSHWCLSARKKQPRCP